MQNGIIINPLPFSVHRTFPFSDRKNPNSPKYWNQALISILYKISPPKLLISLKSFPFFSISLFLSILPSLSPLGFGAQVGARPAQGGAAGPAPPPCARNQGGPRVLVARPGDAAATGAARRAATERRSGRRSIEKVRGINWYLFLSLSCEISEILWVLNPEISWISGWVPLKSCVLPRCHWLVENEEVNN